MSRSGGAGAKRSHGSSAGGDGAESRSGGAQPRRRWTRHLEGWQPGLLAVFLAGTGALLAVPRPVEPAELPMPLADARALSLSWEADSARARAAEQLGLDADVRELGSAFRAFGVVDVDPDRTDVGILAARKRVLDAAGPALAQGDEAVLRLRAYQLRSFLQELRRWEVTGEESDPLRELAGDFIGLLRRNGWLAGHARGAPVAQRVAMDATVLGVLFKKRWSAITGVHRSPFDATLDEERALFGFLLSHPISAVPSAAQLGADIATTSAVVAEASLDGGSQPAAAAAIAAARARRAEEQYRLKKIEELAVLDPAYPRDLARGVVLYRLGKYLPAVEAFRRHLDRFPDGSYTLRARNYLRAALGRARDEQV
jgi:hypothetical protein